MEKLNEIIENLIAIREDVANTDEQTNLEDLRKSLLTRLSICIVDLEIANETNP